MTRFLQYLEDHVDENISLEEAAGWCALAKSQFPAILFKKGCRRHLCKLFQQA
ncbi:MAG: hypothetical protein ACLR0U_17930 [Enterocloster clostridioformis]